MKHHLYQLLFLFFFCSCTAPRVVTYITPEAPEGNYAMGREYIKLESDQIGVELGYDGIQGDKLVFDFVVHNSTSDTLYIQPSTFYYVVLDSASAESSAGNSWMSVHPDQVLTHYDETLESRKEDKSVNTFLGVLQAGAAILYNTTAFIATDNPGYLADAVLYTVGTAEEYISQDRAISKEMEWISEEKEVVDEEIFRENKLIPGQVASGYVYFPRHEQTEYYMFCFPLGRQLFQFVYNQHKEFVYN